MEFSSVGEEEFLDNSGMETVTTMMFQHQFNLCLESQCNMLLVVGSIQLLSVRMDESFLGVMEKMVN